MLRNIARTTARVAVRGYATSASKNVQPPVQLFGLDGSYASAVYTASAKSSSIESTEKSLKSLQSLLDKDKKLATILANPSLSATEKQAVVETLVSATSADKIVGNLLKVLSENNRLPLINDVISKFEVLSNAHHGLVEATVTSAEPLDSKILGRLESAIAKSQFVGNGKTLKVNNKINPDILGGIIVEVGDRTVDLSISAKIGRLNKLLTDSV